MVQNAVTVAWAAMVAAVLYVASRLFSRSIRGRGEGSRPSVTTGAGGEPSGEELVAIVAAAIAAATGAEADSFRILSVASSDDRGRAPCFAQRPFRAGATGRGGLNTPAWGHVDRFALGE
jgi:hypothetical protein